MRQPRLHTSVIISVGLVLALASCAGSNKVMKTFDDLTYTDSSSNDVLRQLGTIPGQDLASDG